MPCGDLWVYNRFHLVSQTGVWCPEEHTEFVIVFIFGEAGVIVLTRVVFLVFRIICPWNCSQRLD